MRSGNCVSNQINVSHRKKQLTHRISRWDFEKNVKRKERFNIIQSLSPEMKTTRFETKSYRGRTLDQAKLDRWMKMEGISLDVAKDHVCERQSKRREYLVKMRLFTSFLTLLRSNRGHGGGYCYQL